MITRERVLEALQKLGPSLPVQIKKFLGEGDTFIIGAVLTELRSAGKLLVSNVKRGGSPFYYLAQHSTRLVQLIPDLGEKERRSAQLLQETGVLEDTAQTPLVRVTLRDIKDYAIPIRVKVNDEEKLFWKWYLLTNEEVEKKIKIHLGITEPQKIAPQETPKEAVQELERKEEKIEEKVPKTKHEETPKTPPTQTADLAKQAADSEQVTAQANSSEQRTAKREKEQEKQKELVSEDNSLSEADEFAQQLAQYFATKNIAVLSAQILRKNSDIELEVNVPTPLGHVKYFCKAKNKKKSNEGDLSSIYVQGQVRKLPVIYLTTGEVTKKAKEKLEKEFKGLFVVEL